MAQAAYHVIGSAMSMEPRLNEGGTGIEDVHVIPYQIDSGPAKGHRGQVKIPHSQFSVDTARQAVESEVDVHHQVAAIGAQAATR
jgi:hypothetical protein